MKQTAHIAAVDGNNRKKASLHLHLRLLCAQILCEPRWISVAPPRILARFQFSGVWLAAASRTCCYTHWLLWIIASAKIYCLRFQPHFERKLVLYWSRLEKLVVYSLGHCSQIRPLAVDLPQECAHVAHWEPALHWLVWSGTSNLTSQNCDFFAGVCSLISSYVFVFSANEYKI